MNFPCMRRSDSIRESYTGRALCAELSALARPRFSFGYVRPMIADFQRAANLRTAMPRNLITRNQRNRDERRRKNRPETADDPRYGDEEAWRGSEARKGGTTIAQRPR